MSAEYFFVFLNAYYPNTHLIQFFNFVDSSKPYGRLLENQKTGGSKELFLPGNDFQNSFTKIFQNNIQILETWKPTEDVKFRLEFFFHMPFYIRTHYNIKIVLDT